MSTRIATVVGCVGIVATLGAQPREAAQAAVPKPREFATISTLPSFGKSVTLPLNLRPTAATSLPPPRTVRVRKSD